jgi:hypothetical protein
MDRDTIENFDTIDLGPEFQFERHDTEVVTERLSALDPDDAEPTLQNAVAGTLPWRDPRSSDPLIPPPRR